MGTVNAIEFSGKIEHGTIRLPQIYKDYDNRYVRIIILVDTSDDLIAKKEGLKAAFKSMESTRMFARIENPILWQKEIRDEWE